MIQFPVAQSLFLASGGQCHSLAVQQTRVAESFFLNRSRTGRCASAPVRERAHTPTVTRFLVNLICVAVIRWCWSFFFFVVDNAVRCRGVAVQRCAMEASDIPSSAITSEKYSVQSFVLFIAQGGWWRAPTGLESGCLCRICSVYSGLDPSTRMTWDSAWTNTQISLTAITTHMLQCSHTAAKSFAETKWVCRKKQKSTVLYIIQIPLCTSLTKHNCFCSHDIFSELQLLAPLSLSSWKCCLQKYPTGSSMKSAKASRRISVTGFRSVNSAANLLQLQTAKNSTSEALIDQETFNNFSQPRRTFNCLQRAAT